MSSSVSQRILDIVEDYRRQAKSAEREYDRGASHLQYKASRSIDLFGGTATSQVVEIASDARRLCDTLYAAYQTFVRMVDEECRPLLTEEPSLEAVKAVRDLVTWLNEESEIENNFTASFNSHDLGQVASAKYVPTMESRMIQSYWEGKYDRYPGRAEAEAKAREAARERQRIQEEENRKRRQEAQEQYKKDLAQWETENARVMQERSRIRDAALPEKQSELEREEQDRYRCEQQALYARRDQIDRAIAAASQELPTLGFFQFSRKRELNRQLEQMRIDRSKAEAAMYGLENAHRQRLGEIPARMDAFRKELDADLERRFPAPAKPREPGLYSSAAVSAVQIAHEGIKREIYDALLENGGLMTITEIMQQCPAAADLTNMRVSAIVRQMLSEGSVERVEEKRKAYFRAVVNAAPAYKEPAAAAGREEERRSRMQEAMYAPTPTQLANQHVQDAIWEFLHESGGMHTITEIMEGCPEAADLTNQRVAALLRQMIGTRVERIESQRMAYFRAID